MLSVHILALLVVLLTCALTPNSKLDFGGNFSLNGVAPRAQFYMGLSQRF